MALREAAPAARMEKNPCRSEGLRTCAKAASPSEEGWTTKVSSSSGAQLCLTARLPRRGRIEMGDVPRRNDEERAVGADAVGLGTVERLSEVARPAEGELVERRGKAARERAHPSRMSRGGRCLAAA